MADGLTDAGLADIRAALPASHTCGAIQYVRASGRVVKTCPVCAAYRLLGEIDRLAAENAALRATLMDAVMGCGWCLGTGYLRYRISPDAEKRCGHCADARALLGVRTP